MIWFNRSLREICRRCCSCAEQSSPASWSWHLSRALPCSDVYTSQQAFICKCRVLKCRLLKLFNTTYNKTSELLIHLAMIQLFWYSMILCSTTWKVIFFIKMKWKGKYTSKNICIKDPEADQWMYSPREEQWTSLKTWSQHLMRFNSTQENTTGPD